MNDDLFERGLNCNNPVCLERVSMVSGVFMVKSGWRDGFYCKDCFKRLFWPSMRDEHWT